jgi:hypothetical protein
VTWWESSGAIAIYGVVVGAGLTGLFGQLSARHSAKEAEKDRQSRVDEAEKDRGDRAAEGAKVRNNDIELASGRVRKTEAIEKWAKATGRQTVKGA